jgi:hypothetical protein
MGTRRAEWAKSRIIEILPKGESKAMSQSGKESKKYCHTPIANAS